MYPDDKHRQKPPTSSRHKNKPAEPSDALDTVIIDMDGVVTDTADAHAEAWKRLFDEYFEEKSRKDFQPFDIDTDYREYVDGKPRYDGVRSFLASRNIELPFGDPADGREKETVCGLGNRKNSYFHEWLDNNRVRTYPTTIWLIEKLRAAGIRIGIFTSSRNGRAVLTNAGIEELFDARVDGNDLAKLGIPGKPDPAMLLEAASRLESVPARTAVIEDAISGVEAGAAGKFALVIGVDRDDYGDALAAHGAGLVVHDLGELSLDKSRGFSVKTLKTLAKVWDREAEIRQRLSGREIIVFLDYDGTLTPIVEDYRKAYLSDEMRETVRELATRCRVGVISGRDLHDLRELVGLERVLYAGSHGFDIELPGELRETLEKGKKFLPDLDAAEERLKGGLSDIEGCAIERKRFAIAVHYRRVAADEVARVEKIVDDVIDDRRRLRKGHGKKVFQVQPRLSWNKGRAVEWLLERLDLNREDTLPLYVGDDLTDEDAFRSLAGNGISIAVGEEERPTSAQYALATTDEVGRFLRLMIKLIDRDRQ